MSDRVAPAGFAEPDRQAALDWLLAACRRWLGDEAAPQPPAPPSAVLGPMAFWHNLEPLLHLLCARGELRAPDAALESRWQEAYYQSLTGNSAVLDSLCEMLERWRRAGVEVIVLKGLATAATAYGDAALRTMSDVDLLCREGDLLPLCRVAGEVGYRSGGEGFHDLRILHPDLGLQFEIHYAVYDLIADRRGFLERAWAGRTEVELDGRMLPALAIEMAVTFSLAHLVNHDFRVNLRSCLDLAGLMAGTRETLDPALLRRELVATELEEEMALLLVLLADLFGFAPAVAGLVTEPPEVAGRLRRTVRRQLLNIERGSRQAALAGTRSRPWRARPRYLLRLLFPPPSHLRALRQLRPGVPAGYAAHVLATLRRGWRGLRGRRGGPEPGAASAKYRAHRRRAGRWWARSIDPGRSAPTDPDHLD